MKRPGAKSTVHEQAVGWDKIQKGPSWQKKIKTLGESLGGMSRTDGLSKQLSASMEDRAKLLVMVNVKLTELRESSPVDPGKGEKVYTPFIGENLPLDGWLDSQDGRACLHVLPTIWQTTFLKEPDKIYLDALLHLSSAQFHPKNYLNNLLTAMDNTQKDMSVLWFYYTYLASSAPPEFTVLVDGACMHLVYSATSYLHANIKLIAKHNQIIPRAIGRKAEARGLVELAVKEIGEESLLNMKPYPRAKEVERKLQDKGLFVPHLDTIKRHLLKIFPAPSR